MKEFKILNSVRVDDRIPKSVPWGFIEQWESKITRNHYQSLERLNERGGLSVLEIYAAAHDVSILRIPDMHFQSCLEWLRQKVDQWTGSHEKADGE